MQLKNRKGVVLTESSQMSDKYVSSKGLVIRSFGKALNICESIKMKPIKYLWNIRRGPCSTSLTLETVPSKNKKKLEQSYHYTSSLVQEKRYMCIIKIQDKNIISPSKKEWFSFQTNLSHHAFMPSLVDIDQVVLKKR